MHLRANSSYLLFTTLFPSNSFFPPDSRARFFSSFFQSSSLSVLYPGRTYAHSDGPLPCFLLPISRRLFHLSRDSLKRCLDSRPFLKQSKLVNNVISSSLFGPPSCYSRDHRSVQPYSYYTRSSLSMVCSRSFLELFLILYSVQVCSSWNILLSPAVLLTWMEKILWLVGSCDVLHGAHY